MRSSYRTVAAASALLSACESAAGPEVQILAHYVPACAPSAADAPAQLELVALGDFDRSNESVSIVASNAAGQALSLPPGTRAAELSTLGDRRYWGAGALNTREQIPVLLWPRNQSCALAQLQAPTDALSSGELLLGGSSARSRLLAVWSRAQPGEPFGVEVNLDDGESSELWLLADQLAPFAHAAFSELDGALVLSGGIDPDTARASSELRAFDPETHSFDLLAPLAGARARHAALSLPSGETLLVGGEGPDGRALNSVELLASRDGRMGQPLELLGAPRIEPAALRLDATRILIAGGYVRDPNGERVPVSSVEFSSFDLTDVTDAPIRLEPAALDRAFVALGAGSALAAGGCSPGRNEPDCLPCERGCVSREVWWIDALGEATELEALPRELSVPAPRLVAGAGGAPWLIAGERLGRFDPWSARFELVESAPSGAKSASFALNAGSFMWLEPGALGVQLAGLYHSQRGDYSQDVAPLLVGSGQGLLPQRPPTRETSGDVVLHYDVSAGLSLASSAAVVSVVDTLYADFALELTLVEGPAPLLKLAEPGAARGEGAAFGGFECPWPAFSTPASSSAPATVQLSVRRRGDEVRLSVGGTDEAAAPCLSSLPERVNIQVVGTPLGTTRLTRIEVRRSL